jgi:hypothetical protein
LERQRLVLLARGDWLMEINLGPFGIAIGLGALYPWHACLLDWLLADVVGTLVALQRSQIFDILQYLLKIELEVKLAVNTFIVFTFGLNLLDHVGKIAFVDLYSVKVIAFAPEPPLALVIFIFQNPNSLPQIATNILYSTLTFSVVNNHLKIHFFIWKIKDFVNVCLNLDVIIGFKAAKTPCILHIAFKIEFLLRQPLNSLALNQSELRFFIKFLIPFLNIRYVLNSLTFQKFAFHILIITFLLTWNFLVFEINLVINGRFEELFGNLARAIWNEVDDVILVNFLQVDIAHLILV